MIRINLLPVKEAARRESGKQIIILFIVMILAEVAALFFIQSSKQTELDVVKASNQNIQKSIASLKEKTKAVAQLETEKQRLEQQKQVLDTLKEGQGGPVKMLDELSSVLTVIDDPIRRSDTQNLGWNPDWDPKTVWIASFVEKDRKVQISGLARTNDDVAEFLRRLSTTRHFVSINLNVSQTFDITLSETAAVRLVSFTLDALAIYGPADVKRLAEGSLGEAKSK